MYYTSVLSLAALLAAPASAFWRLPCVSPLVQERADPIVNPGAVSGHLHTIMGGNGFDFTMDYSSTQASTCSSCTVQGDRSNYWTPVLFYKGSDGKFEKVDQIGGATVYYLQRNAQGEDIVAFPKGFRMLAGDPFKRSGGSDAASQAVSYHCLDYSGGDKPETGAFPTSNCPDGIRSQIFFPSCWDGKNLDSADHKSHVSYPDGAYNAGTCPSTHPVRLMAIFYEIIWDTNRYKDQWTGGQQPFVWSMGDPTGYGFHGDFINGWDVDLLQKAADQCTNLSGRVEDCPLFNLTPDSTARGCKKASQINDVITGTLDILPGCNPIQPGPSRATPASVCTAPKGISAVSNSAYFTDLTSQGWSYLGCATDNYYDRSMAAATTTDANMTNAMCAQYCQSKGYSMAATEYSKECYCGNSFPSDRMPVAGTVGNCDMGCAGDASQMCGGSGLMSLYKKCSGSSCVNVQVGVAAATVASTGVGAKATAVTSASPKSSTTGSASKSSGVTSSTTTKTSTVPSSSTSSTMTRTTTTSNTSQLNSNKPTTFKPSPIQPTSKSSAITTTTTTTSPTTSTTPPTTQCTPGPLTLLTRHCNVTCTLDRPGGGYKSLRTPTWALCMQACASDPHCVTAQYHANIQTCYLKNTRNAGVVKDGEMTVDCDVPGAKTKRSEDGDVEVEAVVAARRERKRNVKGLGRRTDRVLERMKERRNERSFHRHGGAGAEVVHDRRRRVVDDEHVY